MSHRFRLAHDGSTVGPFESWVRLAMPNTERHSLTLSFNIPPLLCRISAHFGAFLVCFYSISSTSLLRQQVATTVHITVETLCLLHHILVISVACVWCTHHEVQGLLPNRSSEDLEIKTHSEASLLIKPVFFSEHLSSSIPGKGLFT